MKQELLEQRLTNIPQALYARSGDTFMEVGKDMKSTNQPSQTERIENNPLDEAKSRNTHQNRKPPEQERASPKTPIPVPQEKQDQARKAWEEATKGRTLSVDERGMMERIIQMGRSPIEGAAVDDTGISDPLILQQLQRIRTVIEGGVAQEGVYREALENLIKLPASVPDAELKLAISKVQNELIPFENARMASANARPEGFWMKLKPEDFIMLRSGKIEEWVNKQYDILYTGTQGTRVADSPLLSDAQAGYSEATLYLSKILQQPEQIAQLRNYFETRLNLIVMSSTISTKNLENVQQAAGRLLATGLLHGTSLDNGRVGSMFNRACELLEDVRLKGDRGHLTPLMWEELRRDLIEQQLELAHKGVGDFVLSDEEKEDYLKSMDVDARKLFENLPKEGQEEVLEKQINNNITRSVNTALDIVVSSQRLHIIAARGKELFGNKSFFSDAGSAFRVFNLETFHAYKWQLYNINEVKMNNLVKKSLIDEWLEGKDGSLEGTQNLTPKQIEEARRRLELRSKYSEQLGDSLLKEMSTVNDFFSNGWRIEGMLDQLDRYFAHKEAKNIGLIGEGGKGWEKLTEEQKNEFMKAGREKANDFGLFFRLRGPRGGLDNRNEVWKKIVQYRPEEIVRLLRDRISELDPELKASYGAIFQGTEIKDYDKFKEEFGSAIRALREEGMQADDPYQIDFTNLTEPQKQKLNIATDNRADIVVKICKQMQNYIRDNYIQEQNGKTLVIFEWDPRFADIYNRALNTDDALLGRLEDVQREFGDMTAISKIWSADIGGDVLVRNMSDIAAGQHAVEEYMKFIGGRSEKDKLDAAEKCANFYKEPNGPPARAKVLRHTYISFLEASILPELLQSIGIKHLPWRLPATEIQKIYGPQMEGFSVDELLDKRDHIKGLLIANADQARKEAEAEIERIEYNPSLNTFEKEQKKGEQYRKIESAEEDAHKQSIALDKILKLTVKDRIRLKAYNILFMLLIVVLGEALEVTGVKELMKQK